MASNDFGFIPDTQPSAVKPKATKPPVPAAQPAQENEFGFIPEPETATPAPVPSAATPAAEPKTPSTEAAGMITEDELKEIAKRHGVKPDLLRESVGWFNGQREMPKDAGFLDFLEEGAKKTAGFVGRSAGLSVPQWLYKKAQDEKYRGALDDLDSLIRDKQSWKDFALEFGTSVAGGGGIAKSIEAGLGPTAAKLAGKLAVPGGMFTEGAATAKEGEEVKEGTMSAGLGMGLGVFGYLAGKAVKALSRGLSGESKVINKLLNNPKADETLLEHGRAQMKLRAPEVESGKKAILEGADNDPEAQALLKDLGRFDTLEEAKAQLGDKALLKEYEDLKLNQYMEEKLPEIAGVPDDFNQFTAAVSKLSDARPVAMAVDRRTQGATRVTEALDNISRISNVHSIDRAKQNAAIKRYFDGKSDTFQKELSESLRREMPVGSVTEKDLTDYREKVTEPLRLWYKDMTGVDIPPLEFYMPKTRMPGEGYVRAMTQRLDDLNSQLKDTGIDLLSMTQEDYAKLQELPIFKSKEMKEFLSETQDMMGGIQNGRDLSIKLNKILNNDYHLGKKLNQDAFFAKRREGDIPEFVQDKNVQRTLRKWVDKAIKSQTTTEISKLRRSAKIAEDMGMPRVAKYTRDLIDGITGAEQGLSNTLAPLQQKIVRAEQRATNPVKKKALQAAREVFPIMNSMTGNLYVDKLGFNPKSLLQNVTSPYLTMYPELGAGYGTKVALESSLDFAKAMKDGLPSRIRSPELAKKLGKKVGDTVNLRGKDLLSNEGMIENQFTGEIISALEDGLSQSAVRTGIEKYNKAIQDKGMALFEQSEKLARLLTLTTGRRVARDLMGHSKGALQFLSKIKDPGTRNTVRRAIQAGDQELVENEIVKYLNSEHMFHYDRAHMSQFGRQAGPMFRMFTKWPAHIAGRAYMEMADRHREPVHLMKKLVAPWAMLTLAWQLGGEDSVNDMPVLKKALGRGGPATWTPLDSVDPTKLPVISKGVADVPVLQIVNKGLQAAGKEETIPEKAADFMAETIVPYALPIRGTTFSETLPEMLSGERPQFESSRERAIAGPKAAAGAAAEGLKSLRDLINKQKEE